MLPDVRTDILKPEVIMPQQSQISIPILPTLIQSISINEKKDELLLNVDEEESIEHTNNTSNRILEDLNDLLFEENRDQVNLTEIKPAGKENIILIFISIVINFV